MRRLMWMAAGKYDADVTHLSIAVGAAVAGKTAEALGANPYRLKSPASEAQTESESKRAFAMLGAGLKHLA